jgi:hypothetical protein
MVEIDHRRGFIFLNEQLDEFKLHVFFVFEIVDDQAGMNAYSTGNFADGGAFEPLLDEHLIVALEDIRFSERRAFIFPHDHVGYALWGWQCSFSSETVLPQANLAMPARCLC